MKKTLTLLALAPLAVIAQTTWEVEAGGSTGPGQTDPYYLPMMLTIHVGDSVHWTAVSGSHNVYGMHDDFPDNPEEFNSGQPSQDLDFTFVFNIPGEYGYHCTQNGHSATQHGMILVEDGTQVQEAVGKAGSISLFPVPSSGRLTIGLEDDTYRIAQIVGTDGRTHGEHGILAGASNTIDISRLANGRYMLRLINRDGNAIVRPFVKE